MAGTVTERAGPDERLDRQVRIPGWNQEGLAQARIGLVGDDPWLTGLVVAAASALGINHLSVVAPALEPRLLEAARGLNPELNLALFSGFFSHHVLEDLLSGCQVLVDLSHRAFATKLLLNLAHRENLPLVRGFAGEEDGRAQARVFSYLKGREWRELLKVLPGRQLPSIHRGDPVLALIIGGLVLEEVKKLLLGERVTEELVSYTRGGGEPAHLGEEAGGGGSLPLSANTLPQPLKGGKTAKKSEPMAPTGVGGGLTPPGPWPSPRRAIFSHAPIAVVGAGALGNFVGLGLAAWGFGSLTFMDPEPVELTNLNRQILFWDSVGQPKAKALAQRLAAWFGVKARGILEYVTRDTDLGKYAVVFDGTDNFESRIVLSEKCREGGQILISGGTGVTAGQVVVYDPARGGPTPAELLGLSDIVKGRDVQVRERERASCLYAPEPAVIMTNQIVGGLMVDALRRLLAGEEAPNLFYDAQSERML